MKRDEQRLERPGASLDKIGVKYQLTPSKRSETVPLFTMKSVKQVRVKRFKSTGLDYRVQFVDLQRHGLPDVPRQLHEECER